MPPISPMPLSPEGIPAPPWIFFFGMSATMALIRRAATEAAFRIAMRTTLVGSMMPLEIKLTYSFEAVGHTGPFRGSCRG